MTKGFEIERIGGALKAAHSAPEASDWMPAEAPVAWRCDLSDERLSWEAGVFDLFGLPRGVRIDRPDVLALYCDQSREALERARSAAIEQRGGFVFEARIRRIDGVWRMIRIVAQVASSNGRATHLHGTKQDVTIQAMLAGRFEPG